MVADQFMQNEMIYLDATHQYFNLKKEEYTSVSRVLDRIKVPFDREGRSRQMARGIANESGITVEQAQADLLKEWDNNKDFSVDKGNYVHDGLDKYATTGKIEEGLEGPVKYMQGIFKQYYRFFPEIMLFSHEYRVAGRTDLILQRQNSKTKPVLDFIDYKTNASKGIQFDSIKRKDGEVKHYNRYFLPPFDYLEDCNYNTYSLQLSIYAFLAFMTGRYRIGKLAIIYFDNQFVPHYIAVPFLFHEARMLCEMNTTIKALPTVIGSKAPERELDPIKAEMMRRAKYPMRPEECYRSESIVSGAAGRTSEVHFEIKDDWD